MLNIGKLNDYTEQSSSDINKPVIPKEIPYGYPTGWICPKCGRVYGPYVSMCPYCGNNTFEITCIYY